MSDTETTNDAGGKPPRNPTVLYAIVAALLVVIIVIAAYLLITQGLPALRGDGQPTGVAEDSTATPVPTFTPVPTQPPTDTPLPVASPTMAAPVMQDTDAPIFDLESAGGRPSTEWTGFFGQVLDADGNPLADVPLIIWYADAEGRPAELVDSGDSPVVKTAADGSYEMRLADAPFQGVWSIQVLTSEGGPASKLFTFETSDSPDTGFQQIQVLWRKLP